ncbi:MAG: DUF1365 domain-containing protein [Caulobacteraceae bacterium]|nr:DUF1365 domain-containing protein [Caulobacteraceae bacterium]
MSEVVSLYVGETTHHRFEPRPHAFRYRLFQILVDIDRAETAFPRLISLRHGRQGLFSFAERDHGPRDGSPLRPWVEARLAEAGLTTQARTIRLLCFPRVLGFVFNPLSIFFVHDARDRLEAVIYEVNNTFGQTHAYVVPATGAAVEHQEADKVFYVSPFYAVEGGYRFRITPPGDAIDLIIIKHKDGKPDFNAKLVVYRRPLTEAALLSLFFAMPLMTLGVVAAIHWEALRLWIKKNPFGVRPPGPSRGVSAGRVVRRSL